MKSALKILALILAVSLIAMTFVACDNGTSTSGSGSGSGSGGESTDSIQMACILPLTGNAAQSGIAAQKALNLNFKQFNDAGGVNGRTVELTYYDDMNDSKESVNCAELVIENDDYLCVFGAFNSSCTLAIAPMFEEAGICQLAPTGVEEFTTEYSNTVRLSLTQPARLKWSAEYAYNIHGFRTGVILYAQDDNGVALAQLFPEYFEELGGEILTIESFNAGTQDYNAVLTSLKAYNPDFIHISGSYSDNASIINQMVDLDWNIPVYATGSAMDNNLISLCGDNANRILMATPVDFNDQSPKFQQYLADWAEAYDGEIPSNTMAVNFAEGSLIAIAALNNGCLDRESFMEFCRNTPVKVDGLTGTYNVIEGEGERTMYMITVRDGKFVSWTEGMDMGLDI